jgi:hypothetical protein
MAQPTLWREPSEIASGDTLLFERSLPDFPASAGWSLNYQVRGGTQVIQFNSTADGTAHSINVPGATTATWVAGDYVMWGYATLTATGERHQIFYGELKIYPNAQALLGDAPEQTFAQQMIAQIEAVLLAKAGNDLALSQLGETKFQYLTQEQLRIEHGYWISKRRNEVAKLNSKNGKPTGYKIRPRINISGTGPILGSQWPGSYLGW